MDGKLRKGRIFFIVNCLIGSSTGCCTSALLSNLFMTSFSPDPFTALYRNKNDNFALQYRRLLLLYHFVFLPSSFCCAILLAVTITQSDNYHFKMQYC